MRCFVIYPHWYDTENWNPSSSQTKAFLFYTVNIMAADVLATQGARVSKTVLFTVLNRFSR